MDINHSHGRGKQDTRDFFKSKTSNILEHIPAKYGRFCDTEREVDPPLLPVFYMGPIYLIMFFWTELQATKK